jgi:hypothetical protein
VAQLIRRRLAEPEVLQRPWRHQQVLLLPGHHSHLVGTRIAVDPLHHLGSADRRVQQRRHAESPHDPEGSQTGQHRVQAAADPPDQREDEDRCWNQHPARSLSILPSGNQRPSGARPAAVSRPRPVNGEFASYAADLADAECARRSLYVSGVNGGASDAGHGHRP